MPLKFQGLFSRITFAQPVVLGGTGQFRNTDHFLEMDAGYSGCIRNLEINNKMYNFKTASNGGDVTQGRDIGENFISFYFTEKEKQLLQ